MAGSIKWFKYTSDSDDVYAIRMDESNGEAMGNADFEATDSAIVNDLPRNIEPRYAIYRNVVSGYQRKIIVCANDLTAATLPSTLTLKTDTGDLSFTLTYYRGEAFKRIPTSLDTGLTDGDVT
jgi:hypothetical protein